MPPATEPQQFQINAPPPHMQHPPGPHGISLQQNMVSVANPVTSMSEENRYVIFSHNQHLWIRRASVAGWSKVCTYSSHLQLLMGLFYQPKLSVIVIYPNKVDGHLVYSLSSVS